MQNLCITPNNKFAVSYTNNNQVVLCSIMTGEATRLDKPIDTSGQSAQQPVITQLLKQETR